MDLPAGTVTGRTDHGYVGPEGGLHRARKIIRFDHDEHVVAAAQARCRQTGNAGVTLTLTAAGKIIGAASVWKVGRGNEEEQG